MKIYKIMAVLLLLLCAFAYAETYSGSCGENVTWELADGALTISGTGAMYNYEYRIEYDDTFETVTYDAPWGCYRYDIESVTIGKGITSIGTDAFADAENLTKITIPDSVTSVGSGAFRKCDSISEIHVDTLSQWLNYDHGSSELYLRGSNGRLFTGNKELKGELIIPDGVTSVDSFVFCGCGSLTTVTIPDGVTTIGRFAFRGCSSLTSVTIPDSVTYIGDSVFSGCSGLKSVTIPEGVKSVGGYAFYNCASLTAVTIPDSVTSVGDQAFYSCDSLTSVTIPDSVTSLGWGVFYQCEKLNEIHVDTLAQWLGYSHGSSHLYLRNSNGKLFIGNKEIAGELIIPDGVKSVGEHAFYNCAGLTAVTIPDSVTTIGISAFSRCAGLASVKIPDSVKSVGDYAFSGCSSLTDVYYGGDNAQKNKISIHYSNSYLTSARWHLRNYGSCGENVSWRINADTELCISGTGAMSAYEAGKQPWLRGAYSTVTVREGVTELTGNAFYGTEITRMYLPESVSVFGDDIVSCSPVVYCYEYSNADEWANKMGFEIVYLDSLSHDDYASLAISEDAVIYRTETHQFTAALVPAIGEITITWTSSDPEVATVDETGLATAHSPGTATITAACGGNTASALLTVQGFAEAGKLIIIGAPAYLEAGDTAQLSVIATPADDSLVYTWRSSDESVLTVSRKGVIKAVAKGTAYVTVKAEGVKASTAKIVCDVHVKSITLPDEIWCVAKIGAEIPCVTEPADASMSLAWTAVRGGYYSVSITDGVLYSIVPGEVTVTVTDRISGLTASTIAHVCYPVTAVILPPELTVDSDTRQFECVCVTRGGNYGNGLVTYTSDNDEVAVITESGLLTVIAPGTVNVTATAIGGKSAVCAVTVAKTGTCGRNLTWRLANGELEISGKGRMTNWSLNTDVPWYDYISDITSVTINGGVTSIGSMAFRKCRNLKEITIPKSLTSVGSRAFYGCSGLTAVKYGGSVDDSDKITIDGYNTALMDAKWICACNNIHYCKNGVCAFCGQSFDLSGLDALVLPEGVSTIGANALSGTAAQVIIVPDGCESIAGGAFEGFTGYISLPVELEGIALPADAVVIYRAD